MIIFSKDNHINILYISINVIITGICTVIVYFNQTLEFICSISGALINPNIVVIVLNCDKHSTRGPAMRISLNGRISLGTLSTIFAVRNCAKARNLPTLAFFSDDIIAHNKLYGICTGPLRRFDVPSLLAAFARRVCVLCTQPNTNIQTPTDGTQQQQKKPRIHHLLSSSSEIVCWVLGILSS